MSKVYVEILVGAPCTILGEINLMATIEKDLLQLAQTRMNAVGKCEAIQGPFDDGLMGGTLPPTVKRYSAWIAFPDEVKDE